jgi:hypothetical protein
MQRFAVRLMVALLTFIAGVAIASVWFFNRREPVTTQSANSVSSLGSTKNSSDTLTPSEPCSLPLTKDQRIDASEAVRIAECFVILNGYTPFPPMKDKSRIAYEGIDSSDPDERLRNRYDTLQPKAYGLLNQSRSKGGWTVAFRYNPNNAEYRRAIPNFEGFVKGKGRAVTMDEYGGSLRVEHQDYILSAFQKLEESSR